MNNQDKLENLKKIKQVLETKNRYLLITHVRPDGDAVGSILAFREALRLMGKSVEAFCENAIPENFKFLEGAMEVKHKIDEIKGKPYDVVIFLDCGSMERGGKEIQHLINDSVTVINIDHHVNENPFGHICWVNTSASSTCEMIYEILSFVESPINEKVATCLYAGILTDTGSFQFSNTNQKVLEVAAKLVGLGANPRYIAENIFESSSPKKLILLAKVLETLKYSKDYKIASVRLTQNMIKSVGASPEDSEGFVNMIRQVKPVKVAVLFREDEGNIIHVGLRSKGSINVEKFARRFGGGGHVNASACRIKGDLAEVEKLILQSLEEYIDSE